MGRDVPTASRATAIAVRAASATGMTSPGMNGPRCANAGTAHTTAIKTSPTYFFISASRKALAMNDSKGNQEAR